MVYIKDDKIDPCIKINDIKVQIVYMPLVSTFGYEYEPSVKIGDYVFIGDKIAVNNVDGFPLISSVSGTVVDFKKKYIRNGKLVDCIVIENDFKERSVNKVGRLKNINNYNKKQFIYKLKNSGISGMWMDDYPTYLKYDIDKKIKYLIVNGVEDDIYVSSDSALMYNYAEEILEGIDAIISIMDIDYAYIAVQENNSKVINKFLKYINTYPNIKLYYIEAKYPGGLDRHLVREIVGLEYKDSPLEVNTIVNNVSVIYAIYEVLKNNTPINSRIITLTGDGIKKKGNYLVKIGSNLSELMLKLDGYVDKNNSRIIVGGGLTGIEVYSDDLIITKDVNTIIITLNKRIVKEFPCIKCGMCGGVCPVNINPALIINNKNILDYDKCIRCGLCNYICPSKIDICGKLNKLSVGDKDGI